MLETGPHEYDGLKGDIAFAIRHLHFTANNLAHLRKIVGVCLLFLALCGVAVAQKPAAPAEDNIACSNKVQPTTGFTECEMLRLSNYMSQMSQIKAESDAQIKPIVAQGNEFVVKVVAIERNKGKQYEAPSQQFPLGRLVPIPAPAAATTSPAKK